jgi:hypothetical protein
LINVIGKDVVEEVLVYSLSITVWCVSRYAQFLA